MLFLWQVTLESPNVPLRLTNVRDQSVTQMDVTGEGDVSTNIVAVQEADQITEAKRELLWDVVRAAGDSLTRMKSESSLHCYSSMQTSSHPIQMILDEQERCSIRSKLGTRPQSDNKSDVFSLLDIRKLRISSGGCCRKV